MRSIGESCWGEDSDYEAECLTPTLRALEPFQGSRLFIAPKFKHKITYNCGVDPTLPRYGTDPIPISSLC